MGVFRGMVEFEYVFFLIVFANNLLVLFGHFRCKNPDETQIYCEKLTIGCLLMFLLLCIGSRAPLTVFNAFIRIGSLLLHVERHL